MPRKCSRSVADAGSHGLVVLAAIIGRDLTLKETRRQFGRVGNFQTFGPKLNFWKIS